jgi:hypothetical protein
MLQILQRTMNLLSKVSKGAPSDDNKKSVAFVHGIIQEEVTVDRTSHSLFTWDKGCHSGHAYSARSARVRHPMTTGCRCFPAPVAYELCLRNSSFELYDKASSLGLTG